MQKTIGSSPSNDIVISDDNTVSRLHAILFIDNGSNLYISDSGSTNGTFVNGKKIKKPIILKESDILMIGNKVINFSQYISTSDDLQNHTLHINKKSTGFF